MQRRFFSSQLFVLCVCNGSGSIHSLSLFFYIRQHIQTIHGHAEYYYINASFIHDWERLVVFDFFHVSLVPVPSDPSLMRSNMCGRAGRAVAEGIHRTAASHSHAEGGHM